MASLVEQRFFELSNRKVGTTHIPYLVSENVPKLGLMLSMRFLEWVQQNPQGCISLPAGKTPKDFIRFTRMLLDDWDSHEVAELRSRYGLMGEKPDLHGLHFVQMDEFYPISPRQHNSFAHFVEKEYIQGFGLDPSKALLMNCDQIPLCHSLGYREVFPDLQVDLSLRNRPAQNRQEELQQQAIFRIDDWCSAYEDSIRANGGIGFFISPIGTDGRIAFNMKGSSLHSCTRLTETNFSTQADTAADLGGINVSSHRKVITIGLETITYNPKAVAIVYSAGEAHADIVRQTLESSMMTLYPASVLQVLPQSRFYLTPGAASKLSDSVNAYYDGRDWNFEKTERAVIGICKKLDCYAHNLQLEDLYNDPRCMKIPELGLDTVQQVIKDVENKLMLGLKTIKNEVILHTGPHHDDIMLGIMPFINRQMRSPSNQVHFAVLTSGYNSVTNQFLVEAMEDTLSFLRRKQIQMVNYPDFFERGYRFKYDKDVYHYLDNVARKDPVEMRRGFCHRLLRDAVGLWNLKSEHELRERFEKEIVILRDSYDGEPNSPEIQQLKGAIREFEEELVWAYAGTPVSHVHHLRLGFYRSGEGFPDRERDVEPMLNLLRELKPTTLSVVIDPEGMGPDTHYKVLQVVAQAVSLWSREEDLSKLKIIGYRNVWSSFHAAEANLYVPVSLDDFAVMEKSFKDSYLTQVKAEFPSPEFDGPFSELAERTWVKQLKDIQLVLGKNYFYESHHPLIRATHGLLFLKKMGVDEFVSLADEMKKMM